MIASRRLYIIYNKYNSLALTMNNNAVSRFTRRKHEQLDAVQLIDWCFMARQHKIGQFVLIYQGDYWLRRLRIANEEHTQTYSCMRYNEQTHATTSNRYALLA